MCKCTPEIRTPFCGRGDCKWPEQDDEIKVQSMHFEDGVLEMQFTPHQAAVANLAFHLGGMLEEQNAKNFVTMDFTHPERGRLSLIVQKVPGKTPTDELKELRARVKELEEYEWKYKDLCK